MRKIHRAQPEGTACGIPRGRVELNSLAYAPGMVTCVNCQRRTLRMTWSYEEEEAARGLAVPMKFTEEVPKREGYYWACWWSIPEVVRLDIIGREKRVSTMGNDCVFVPEDYQWGDRILEPTMKPRSKDGK